MDWPHHFLELDTSQSWHRLDYKYINIHHWVFLLLTFPCENKHQDIKEKLCTGHIKCFTWTWSLLRRMRCNFRALLLQRSMGKILGPKCFFFHAMDRGQQAVPSSVTLTPIQSLHCSCKVDFFQFIISKKLTYTLSAMRYMRYIMWA